MFDLSKTNINSQHQVILASAAALAAGISVYYATSKKQQKEYGIEGAYKPIPMPGSRLPYVGHLLSLGELPGSTLTKWNQEFGPLIQLKMGNQNWVIIADPYIAHDIFMTNGAVASDRPVHTFFDYYSHFGRGISCANANKKWKQARIVSLKILAPQRVRELNGLVVKEADNLVNQLITITARDGHINPISYLQSSALNVVLTTNFGKRVSSIEDPLFKEIMHCVDLGMKYGEAEGDLSQFLPAVKHLDFLIGKKHLFDDLITNHRDPLYKRLIKEALESDTDCLLKNVVALQEEYELDEKDIIVIMADLIAAGSDTVSVSLAWMFAILSHHPQIQKKIQAEIDGFVQAHGRLPTFEERDHLPYLISVQKESIRFRSSVPLGLPHVSTEDIVVRDYLIPKGSVLVGNTIGMHMNPDVYTDPETFNPDRFMDNTRTMSSSANGTINQRDMYLFGWGRRICPGIHLAEVEMFHVCTRLFAKCIIAPPLDKTGKEVPIDLLAAKNAGIVTQPQPYQIRFIPRPDSIHLDL
ncbi:cytochrome P450 [Chlamydoabsidia padenii]|nr:cytochrome P450 [Chlamydoabsidia padenii]